MADIGAILQQIQQYPIIGQVIGGALARIGERFIDRRFPEKSNSEPQTAYSRAIAKALTEVEQQPDLSAVFGAIGSLDDMAFERALLTPDDSDLPALVRQSLSQRLIKRDRYGREYGEEQIVQALKALTTAIRKYLRADETWGVLFELKAIRENSESTVKVAHLQLETQHELLKQLKKLTPEARDNEVKYLEAIHKLYGTIRFAGIPKAAEESDLLIHDLAVDLKAKRAIKRTVISAAEPEAEPQTSRTEPLEGLVQHPGRLNRKDLGRDPLETFETVELSKYLAKTQKVVILGDPGAGKTLLLKRSLIEAAQTYQEGPAEGLFPIFVQLSDYAKKGMGNLIEYMQEVAKNTLQLDLPKTFFADHIENHRCLICLDGLDEVTLVGSRADVRDRVQTFMNNHKQHHYLISSRMVGYRAAPIAAEVAEEVVLEPFNPEQIETFVGKRYGKAEQHNAEARARQIEDLLHQTNPKNNPRVAELAKNPLLLTIIALVHRGNTKLPEQRVELYERCIEAMTKTWDEVQKRIPKDSHRYYYQKRRRILERIAYGLQVSVEPGNANPLLKVADLDLKVSRVIQELTKGECGPDESMEEAKQFIVYCEERTGVLYEQEKDVYGFVHPTFREYLAASDIYQRKIHRGLEGIWQEIKDKLHQANWREVVLLLAGKLGQHDEFIPELVEKLLNPDFADEVEPILHRNLFLAAHILVDQPSQFPKQRREVISQIGGLAMSSAPCQIDAIRLLGRFKGDSEVARVLLSVSQNPANPNGVQLVVGNVLGDLGYTIESKNALNKVIQDTSIVIFDRISAIKILFALGMMQESISLLLQIAKEEDGNHIFHVAKALGEVGEREIAKQILLGKSSFHLVEATHIAESLGSLGYTADALKILLPIVNGFPLFAQNSPYNTLIMASGQIIGQLGFTSLVAKDLQPFIAGCLKFAQDLSHNPHDRGVALATLGLLKDARDVTKEVSEIAFSEKDADVRRYAIRTLAKMDTDGRYVDAFLQFARTDPDIRIRVDVAATLIEKKTSEVAVQILRNIVQDTHERSASRGLAANHLGKAGYPEGLAEVILPIALNSSEEIGTRYAIVRTLAAIADKETMLKLWNTEEFKNEAYHGLKKAFGIA